MGNKLPLVLGSILLITCLLSIRTHHSAITSFVNSAVEEQPPRVIAQSPTKPPKHSLKTIKFWSSTSEVWPNSTKVNEFCSINPVPEDLTFPFRHNCSSFLLCTTDDIIKISSNHATTSHVISCVCESRSQKISDAFGLA